MSEVKNATPPPETRPDDLNRNSEQFWKSRGYIERPADWQTRDPNAPPPTPPKK